MIKHAGALFPVGLGASLMLAAGLAAAGGSAPDERKAVPKPSGQSTGVIDSLNSPPEAVPGPAPTRTGPPSFGVLDLNTDGKLTRAEVRQRTEVASRFDELDTDRDGALSKPEFAAIRNSGPGASARTP